MTIRNERVEMNLDYSLIALPDGHDYSKMEYGKGYQGNGYAVQDKAGKIVAYAWFTVDANKYCLMDKIEVLEKRKGHGNAIVHHLFEELNLQVMWGIVMQEMGGRPYYFWQQLGAEIGDDYYFWLGKESLTPVKQVKELAL